MTGKCEKKNSSLLQKKRDYLCWNCTIFVTDVMSVYVEMAFDGARGMNQQQISGMSVMYDEFRGYYSNRVTKPPAMKSSVSVEVQR